VTWIIILTITCQTLNFKNVQFSCLKCFTVYIMYIPGKIILLFDLSQFSFFTFIFPILSQPVVILTNEIESLHTEPYNNPVLILTNKISCCHVCLEVRFSCFMFISWTIKSLPHRVSFEQSYSLDKVLCIQGKSVINPCRE